MGLAPKVESQRACSICSPVWFLHMNSGRDLSNYGMDESILKVFLATRGVFRCISGCRFLYEVCHDDLDKSTLKELVEDVCLQRVILGMKICLLE